MSGRLRTPALLCLALGALVGGSQASAEEREPCARFAPLRAPWFGDTHVHTAFSQDASTQGTRATPRDAYRFARGEALGIQPFDAEGRPLRTRRLARPLDFAVVTDHAEQLGEVAVCTTPELEGHGSWVCRIYRRWPRLAFYLMNMRATWFDEPQRFGFCGGDGEHCLGPALSRWQTIQQAAEEAYDRSAACRFTSFVGYEWTGATGAKNLHRNVIFRDHNVPRLPASYFEAPSAEALWAALEKECLAAGTGCDVLAIPHNSNLSGGLMFETGGDAALTPARARARARLEPLVEVMQHKGDSECLSGVGAVDEFCDFEALPYDDFQGKYVPWLANAPTRQSFVRTALGDGLRFEREIGANPFRFGLLASSDTHLATPGDVDERSHPGHGGAGAPASDRLATGLVDDLEYNPGGLAVLWAEENTRHSLFSAMRRREAYGTSGPRITLRFFAGWSVPEDLCDRTDFVAQGYRTGVPMGGSLPAAPAEGRTPRLAVRALRDSGSTDGPGTPLQRIQIVKGWADAAGTHERVFDVAGDPDNGADVDPRTCTPRGSGFDGLCRVWSDPDFDPAHPTFYYVRVLENPTCRWSAHACLAAGVDCSLPDDVPEGFADCCVPEHRRFIQERAWSSPVWYTPPR